MTISNYYILQLIFKYCSQNYAYFNIIHPPLWRRPQLHVGFVVDEVAVGQVFLQYFPMYPSLHQRIIIFHSSTTDRIMREKDNVVKQHTYLPLFHLVTKI